MGDFMFHTIVFDLDGTLLNTLEDITDAVNDTMALFGLAPHEIDKVKYMVGDGTDKLLERALEGCSLSSEERMRFKKIYLEKYELYQTRKTKPYPEIEDLLFRAQRRGICLFVFSNKPDFLAQEVVHHYFKGVAFAGILGQKSGALPKPNPTALLEMLKDKNIDLADCVFVGDSDVDILTARNAGLKSIGVTWGFRNKEILQAAHADYIVNEPEDIYDLCIDQRKFCL